MPEYFPPSILSILDKNNFQSEKNVFLFMLNQLNKDSKIYSQCKFLKTTIEGNIIDGESDFIILIPNKGILFLEVKGGIVGYNAKEQQWLSLRRDENKKYKIKDPISQSKKAMFAIRDLLYEQYPEFKRAFLNLSYATCFPDTPRPLDPRPFGPDKPQNLFIFKDDMKNINENINKILDWHRGEKEFIELSEVFQKNFHKLIIGNDLPVKIPLRKSIEIENEKMLFSNNQSFFINIIPSLNYVALKGGAGTGKTLLAIELMRTMASNHKILFLCFNKPLARYIRYSFKGFEEKLYIHNIHQWVSNMKRGLDHPKNSLFELDQEIETVVSEIDNEDKKYDVIIIDEAQDFNDEWMISIEHMLRENGKFYVFYDQQQSIFERKSQYFLKEKFSHLELEENFRNTKQIFELFKNFNKQTKYTSRGVSGSNPEFIAVKNYELQFKWIADKINHLKQHEGIEVREVGVLLYDGLKSTNIKNLSKIIPNITNLDLSPAEYVQPDQLMFETINRIKGLEVPILFFTNFVSPIEIEKLYVGLSRAKNRLFIIGLDSKIEELKKKLG
ncbi:DUF2075 domain-containing protein [Alphaproteobacteria bacterium]|nr:DUF2075 domain-containing protein [Alphaproteobacteria bacterium]